MAIALGLHDISKTTHLMMKFHIPEDLYSNQHCCESLITSTVGNKNYKNKKCNGRLTRF